MDSGAKHNCALQLCQQLWKMDTDNLLLLYIRKETDRNPEGYVFTECFKDDRSPGESCEEGCHLLKTKSIHTFVQANFNCPADCRKDEKISKDEARFRVFNCNLQPNICYISIK